MVRICEIGMVRFWVAGLLLAAALPSAGAVVIERAWTPLGNNRYASPEVSDLDAFRDYFRAVLEGYDQYAGRSAELAAGIVDVGPIVLTLDDSGNFGEIGDTVQFNPLATGGTQDIATGGDYIDRQTNADKHNFEVAHVDIEENVFRQDFGPVQTKRVAAPPGGDPNGEWFEFTFRVQGDALLGPPVDGLTGNPTARLSVLPEPGAGAALIGLGGLVMAGRNRRRLVH